jgi:hypothetical protein
MSYVTEKIIVIAMSATTKAGACCTSCARRHEIIPGFSNFLTILKKDRTGQDGLRFARNDRTIIVF